MLYIGGFQNNAAFYILRHLLNSIELASNLHCLNFELPFDQKNLKISSNWLSGSQDLIENVVKNVQSATFLVLHFTSLLNLNALQTKTTIQQSSHILSNIFINSMMLWSLSCILAV